MNDSKAFFDTNVLLYMYGGEDLSKRTRAQQIFAEYTQADRMLLSTQVIQEFYAVGSRKLGMPRRVLQEATEALLDFPVITVRSKQILAAFQIEERYQISFWDALIVAAAEAGGAAVLFTEDLNHGQVYGAVTAQNPFRI